MTITRRGFLAGMLALGAAPAIVKAANLMKVVAPSTELIVPSQELALPGAFMVGKLERLDQTMHMPLQASTWPHATANEILADVNEAIGQVWKTYAIEPGVALVYHRDDQHRRSPLYVNLRPHETDESIRSRCGFLKSDIIVRGAA